MRLIDADEALRMIKNSKQDNPVPENMKGIWRTAHDCTISCVEAVPTVTGYCDVEKLYDELNACSYPSLCGWAISMDSVRRVLRKYLKED